MEHTAIFIDILVVLLAAKVAGELAERISLPAVCGEMAERISLPAVCGEIVAGLVIGPSAFGLVEGTETLHVLGELGVIVATIGLREGVFGDDYLRCSPAHGSGHDGGHAARTPAADGPVAAAHDLRDGYRGARHRGVATCADRRRVRAAVTGESDAKTWRVDFGARERIALVAPEAHARQSLIEARLEDEPQVIAVPDAAVVFDDHVSPWHTLCSVTERIERRVGVWRRSPAPLARRMNARREREHCS